DVVEEVGRQGWMTGLAVGSPTVTTAGDGFAGVRYDLPAAHGFWLAACATPSRRPPCSGPAPSRGRTAGCCSAGRGTTRARREVAAMLTTLDGTDGALDTTKGEL